MRHFRNLLYFVVGVLLAIDVTFAFAETETTPATYSSVALQPIYKWRYVQSTGAYSDDASSACLAAGGTSLGACSSTSGGVCVAYYCNGKNYGVSRYNLGNGCPTGYTLNGSICEKYSCDTGAGWTGPTTINGVPTCSRQKLKSCSGYQVNKFSTTGIDECVCDAAAWNASASHPGGEWLEGTGSMPPGQICSGGCNFNQGSFGLGGGNKWMVERGSMVGTTCTGDTDGSNGKPPTPNKKPPCAANEGVFTSTKGTVACVPEGTPDARKPLVQQQKQKETYPDNSTKETITTKTTDPATQASSTSQTVVVSGGQAGTAGTTTSDKDSGMGNGSNIGGTGNGDGDGSCDPKEKMCSKPGVQGLYTKGTKTLDSVLSSFSNGVKATPVGQAMTGFFNITTPGGACPQWSVAVAYLNTTVDLGQYACNATLLQALDLLGWALLAVVSFVAFKWAVL